MKPTHPRILPDRDRFRRFYLDEDVVLTLANGDTHIIEKGYRFDGQSIPFIFRFFFPKYDRDIYAALVHDFLIDISPWTRYNRKFQDLEYKRFMEMPEYFATKTRRYFFPRLVRLFGWLKYDLWGDARGIIE